MGCGRYIIFSATVTRSLKVAIRTLYRPLDDAESTFWKFNFDLGHWLRKFSDTKKERPTRQG